MIGTDPNVDAPARQAKAAEHMADALVRMAVAFESIAESMETIAVNSKRESVENAVIHMKSELADAISTTPLDLSVPPDGAIR